MPKRSSGPLKISQAEYEKRFKEAQQRADELAKKLKPLTRKELRATIHHITKRSYEIIGKPITIQATTGRTYPVTQWEEDRKRLED